MKRITLFLTISAVCLLGGSLLAADLTGTYIWRPINIGAGGYADGMICSATDPNVRFVRDDTGQYYRWSATANRWLPMVVQNEDGSGFGKDIIPEKSHAVAVVGNDGGSFALDPNDNNTFYLYISLGTLPYNVYKSTDGGKNFTATHFNDAAGFTMKANDHFCLDTYRQDDECMMVDPNNSKVIYIGTGTKGLFKSVDGGDHWTAMSSGGLPAPRGKNDINILPYKKGGTTSVNGVTVSQIIYVIYAKGLDKTNASADGNVYQSSDGGQTWINITKDAGPTEKCRGGVLDQNSGLLYVRTQNWDTSNVARRLFKYDSGSWTMIKTDVILMTVDPTNSSNLVAMGGGFGTVGGRGDSTPSMEGNTSISTDGGKTWKAFRRRHLRNPTQGFAGIKGDWCYGQLRMDNWGTVWQIVGNNGVLKWKFDANATEILWGADSAGVENLCGMDIVFPKNWGGKILVSCGDEIAFIINNPDSFDVSPLLQNNIGRGYGHTISVCPNDPNTIVVDGSQPFITVDGGKTFFGNGLKDFVVTQLKNRRGFGTVRISRRGDWKAGSDHLVGVFNGGAWYSKDGGNSWSQANNDFSKVTVPTAPWSLSYDLVADPFTPDKFFVYFDQGGFWTTTDGGVTWTQGSTPKDKLWHQLCANEAVQNDLWVATTSGLFHSTDAGVTWQSVPGNAGLAPGGARLAIGKGRGQPGDAPYTLFYVYASFQRDQPAKDYGIYRSTNAGASWDRIASYPCGILNAGGCIGASWDTFGLVGIGAGGQGFVYGKPKEVAQ